MPITIFIYFSLEWHLGMTGLLQVNSYNWKLETSHAFRIHIYRPNHQISCYYAWYYQRYDPTMLLVLVKNGIFKEGVSGSINLHTPSLYKPKPPPRKAKELVKNCVSYTYLNFGP